MERENETARFGSYIVTDFDKQVEGREHRDSSPRFARDCLFWVAEHCEISWCSCLELFVEGLGTKVVWRHIVCITS